MLNQTHYLISDFCIANVDIPEQIADNILLYHLIPMNNVQDNCPFEVYVSYSTKGQPSGWRPYFWEKARGRSGGSQHTFGQRAKTIIKNQKGACDITCEDFEKNAKALLKALIDHSNYTRLALYYNKNQNGSYSGFIHGDYKDVIGDGTRRIFTSTRNSIWTYKGKAHEVDLDKIFTDLT